MDEATQQNDVRYGIADCRKRLRSQRITLRAQHHPPTDVLNGAHTGPADRSVASYAEIFATVSMSQSSLSRLIECLLDPADEHRYAAEESAKREEAVIT